MERLKTNRFDLVPMSLNFVTDTYLSWLNNEQTARYIVTANSTRNLSDLIKYVEEKLHKEDVAFWAIVERLTGHHIGNIKYEPVNFEESYAIMGVLIGDLRWQGQGVVPEVLRATLGFLGEKGIQKVSLGVRRGHQAAIKAYIKAGFYVDENCRQLATDQTSLSMSIHLT